MSTASFIPATHFAGNTASAPPTGARFRLPASFDSRWNDNDLNQLKTIPGSAFEVVDTGPILTS